MEPDYKAIGSRIKAARLGRGMSQAELAKQAGISPATLGRIEEGQSRLRLPVFVNLAQALSLPMEALLRDNGKAAAQRALDRQLADCLASCDAYELRVITALVRAAKDALQENGTPRK